jgi:predicted DNA-binding ribbon-helix-helix protein
MATPVRNQSQVHVRLEPTVWRRLQKMGKQRNMSASKVIANLIDVALAVLDEKEKKS